MQTPRGGPLQNDVAYGPPLARPSQRIGPGLRGAGQSTMLRLFHTASSFSLACGIERCSELSRLPSLYHSCEAAFHYCGDSLPPQQDSRCPSLEKLCPALFLQCHSRLCHLLFACVASEPPFFSLNPLIPKRRASQKRMARWFAGKRREGRIANGMGASQGGVL